MTRALLPACLGGWCTKRDRCARHTQADRSEVAERLCKRGHEQPESAGYWLRRDGWVDLLREQPEDAR